jgi:hypothetical protein
MLSRTVKWEKRVPRFSEIPNSAEQNSVEVEQKVPLAR